MNNIELSLSELQKVFTLKRSQGIKLIKFIIKSKDLKITKDTNKLGSILGITFPKDSLIESLKLLLSGNAEQIVGYLFDQFLDYSESTEHIEKKMMAVDGMFQIPFYDIFKIIYEKNIYLTNFIEFWVNLKRDWNNSLTIMNKEQFVNYFLQKWGVVSIFVQELSNCLVRKFQNSGTFSSFESEFLENKLNNLTKNTKNNGNTNNGTNNSTNNKNLNSSQVTNVPPKIPISSIHNQCETIKQNSTQKRATTPRDSNEKELHNPKKKKKNQANNEKKNERSYSLTIPYFLSQNYVVSLIEFEGHFFQLKFERVKEYYGIYIKMDPKTNRDENKKLYSANVLLQFPKLNFQRMYFFRETVDTWLGDHAILRNEQFSTDGLKIKLFFNDPQNTTDIKPINKGIYSCIIPKFWDPKIKPNNNYQNSWAKNKNTKLFLKEQNLTDCFSNLYFHDGYYWEIIFEKTRENKLIIWIKIHEKSEKSIKVAQEQLYRTIIKFSIVDKFSKIISFEKQKGEWQGALLPDSIETYLFKGHISLAIYYTREIIRRENDHKFKITVPEYYPEIESYTSRVFEYDGYDWDFDFNKKNGGVEFFLRINMYSKKKLLQELYSANIYLNFIDFDETRKMKFDGHIDKQLGYRDVIKWDQLPSGGFNFDIDFKDPYNDLVFRQINQTTFQCESPTFWDDRISTRSVLFFYDGFYWEVVYQKTESGHFMFSIRIDPKCKKAFYTSNYQSKIKVKISRVLKHVLEFNKKPGEWLSYTTKKLIIKFPRNLTQLACSLTFADQQVTQCDHNKFVLTIPKFWKKKQLYCPPHFHYDGFDWEMSIEKTHNNQYLGVFFKISKTCAKEILGKIYSANITLDLKHYGVKKVITFRKRKGERMGQDKAIKLTDLSPDNLEFDLIFNDPIVSSDFIVLDDRTFETVIPQFWNLDPEIESVNLNGFHFDGFFWQVQLQKAEKERMNIWIKTHARITDQFTTTYRSKIHFKIPKILDRSIDFAKPLGRIQGLTLSDNISNLPKNDLKLSIDFPNYDPEKNLVKKSFECDKFYPKSNIYHFPKFKYDNLEWEMYFKKFKNKYLSFFIRIDPNSKRFQSERIYSTNMSLNFPGLNVKKNLFFRKPKGIYFGYHELCKINHIFTNKFIVEITYDKPQLTVKYQRVSPNVFTCVIPKFWHIYNSLQSHHFYYDGFTWVTRFDKCDKTEKITYNLKILPSPRNAKSTTIHKAKVKLVIPGVFSFHLDFQSRFDSFYGVEANKLIKDYPKNQLTLTLAFEK